MANICFCIREEIGRPCQGLVEGFRGIPTSNINDEMNRLIKEKGVEILH